MSEIAPTLSAAAEHWANASTHLQTGTLHFIALYVHLQEVAINLE